MRKDYGPLMRKVQNATEALQEEGVVESPGSVVVILVREKPSMRSMRSMWDQFGEASPSLSQRWRLSYPSSSDSRIIL